MPKNVLFLTLRVFSATGGIEKVCKILGYCLDELLGGHHISKMKVFSMYDSLEAVDEKYIPRKYFYAFNERKYGFVKYAVTKGRKSDLVILSHINLLLIGYLIKLLSPKTKLLLFAHGIEVWEKLPFYKMYMLKKIDLILPVSKFTKEKMKALYALPEDKFTVLNNCLDPFMLPGAEGKIKDTHLLHSMGFRADDFILLTLTRLSSKELYKGYDNVLKAISSLKEKYPQLKYLIVGKYDDAEKKRMDHIIKLYSLEKRVVFTGFIPDEELPAHYNLADLYIMPSKKEGFGIVFIEAMQNGLPVIAGNKDGSVDALLDGKLGLLVDPDNQGEINEAIEKVMHNPNIYKPDRKLIKTHFGFDAYKNKFKTIVEQI